MATFVERVEIDDRSPKYLRVLHIEGWQEVNVTDLARAVIKDNVRCLVIRRTNCPMPSWVSTVVLLENHLPPVSRDQPAIMIGPKIQGGFAYGSCTLEAEEKIVQKLLEAWG